ncbi:MAG: hypothetical protein NC935_05540 [Candidatus Omnitrophica bacterium]|nr:hypothetical protein [Candidatus Omnitrophota bacterium]
MKKINHHLRKYKKFALLLFLLLTTSCSKIIETTPPTYSRKDIVNIIKKMCYDEFNITVQVWEVGDSIWVYAPFEDIITEKGEWRKEVSTDLDRIYLSLARTILSMDRRPLFYCFAISDIKNGYDIYFIWYIPDFMMFQFGYISRGQFLERRALIYFPNPAAINDKEGNHIKPYDISLGEFVAYLISQNLQIKFTSDELKDILQLEKLTTDYQNTKLTVEVDAKITKYQPNLIDPIEEAKSMVKKFLKIYGEKANITEIEIKTPLQSRIYSPKALFEENIFLKKTI